MALAKFREDIVSRFHQATVIRAKEHDALLTPEAEPKGAPTKLKGFAAPQPRPLPVIVLAGVAAVGWLSMLPQNGRDVLTRMHQLLEDPAKPVQTFMLDGKESEYLARVDMPYELEWETRNLDRFYLYVPGEAAGNASVVITHFEDGWKLACLFVNVSSDPSCKELNYPQ